MHTFFLLKLLQFIRLSGVVLKRILRRFGWCIFPFCLERAFHPPWSWLYKVLMRKLCIDFHALMDHRHFTAGLKIKVSLAISIFGSFCSGVCFTTRVLEKLASQCCGEACLTLAVLQIVLQKLPRTCCSANCFAKASLILAVLEALFHTRHFVCFDMKKCQINCLINGQHLWYW